MCDYTIHSAINANCINSTVKNSKIDNMNECEINIVNSQKCSTLNQLHDTVDDTLTLSHLKECDNNEEDNDSNDYLPNVSLEHVCNIEGNYHVMKRFVEEFNVKDLKKEVDDIFINFNINDVNEKFKMLLMLRVFKKIKLMEKSSNDYYINYQNIMNEYNKSDYNDFVIDEVDHCDNHGINHSDNHDVNDPMIHMVDLVHNFNIKDDVNKKKSEYVNLMQNILTEQKMNNVLLAYELLNYRPSGSRIVFDNNNTDITSELIRAELNRFNPIIQQYLEDREWTINYKNTLNFSVPKNKIVISNTISMNHTSNNVVTEHMNMLRKYIRRNFKTESVKCAIVEDNKYDLSWTLISIGINIHDKS
jgi:hypothetical protein